MASDKFGDSEFRCVIVHDGRLNGDCANETYLHSNTHRIFRSGRCDDPAEKYIDGMGCTKGSIQKRAGQLCSGEGNPCDAGTGNKYQTEVDFETSSLRFERYYNSLYDTTAGHIGTHWSHSYSASLTIGETTIEVHRPNGQLLTFDKASLNSDPDIFARLRADGTNWVYKTTDNRSETYNSTGELVSFRELSGLTTTLTHTDGELTSVTDPYGRSLSFNYNTEGRLQTLTFPGKAQIISYRYAGANLSAVDYPAEGGGVETRTYHYEDPSHPHGLTAITDENGVKYAEWKYFGNGLASQSKHFGGAEQVDFVFSPHQTEVTDALGKVRTYTFQLVHGMVKPTGISDRYTDRGETKTLQQQFTYNAEGQTETRTDANGNVTHFEYYTDEARRGLLRQRTEAVGTPHERITSYDWHSEHRVPIRITEPTRETLFEYAGPNCTTAERFHLCQRTVTDRASNEQRAWTFQYVNGLLTRVDGPRTDVEDVTALGYHPNNELASVTNALGHETRYFIDDNGRVNDIHDPRGVRTILGFDPRGRLRSRSVSRGGITHASSSYEYYPNGLLKTFARQGTDTLNFGFDKAHRLVSIINGVGDQIVFQLDAMGNRTLEATLAAADAVSDPESADAAQLEQAAKRLLKREFNELGRMTLQIGGAGQLTRFAFDGNGNLIAQSDPRQTGSDPVAARLLDPLTMDHSQVITYDPLNRAMTDTRLRAGEAGNDVVTEYDFTPYDAIARVTDPTALETLYDRNGFGDLKTLTSPDTGVTTFDYDEAGNRKSATDARRIVTRFRFDAINRRIATDYDDDRLDISLDYDQCPDFYANGSCVFGPDRGLLSRVIDQSGTTLYGYDAFGQRAEIREHHGTAHQTVTRSTYDWDLKRSQLYPSGRSVVYQRDAAGQVSQVTLTDPAVTDETLRTKLLASDLSYQPFGDLKGMIYGNNTNYQAEHDQAYRLTSGVHANSVGTPISGGLLLDYNPADDLIQIDQWQDRLSQGFDYSPLRHLTDVIGGPHEQQFDLDDIGNREEHIRGSDVDHYGYAIDSHRLQSITGANPVSFSYDAAGNTETRGNRGFNFGEDGRLQSVTSNGSEIARYTYNAAGQRRSKTSAAGSVVFHYDPEGQLIAETDTQGNTKHEYVYVNGQRLSLLTGTSPSVPTTTIDFNTIPIESYGGASQDKNGTVSLENGGSAIRIAGNTWKKIHLPYTLTPNTILEFDFSSSSAGEVQGIGFDLDNTISVNRTFKVYGTQSWGILDFDNYDGSGNTTHYRIPAGQFLTGDMTYLIFAGDHDVANPTGDAVYSNIRIYEDNAAVAGALPAIDFSTTTIESYGGASQDKNGTVSIESGGSAVRIAGNTWKKISLPYTLTPNTILEFDFSSSSAGEVQGIGFDLDNTISVNRTFKVYGTQNWGILDFDNYDGSGSTTHYLIPAGEFLTGNMTYLIFAGDHDVPNPTGEAVYSNIRIYEDQAATTADLFYFHTDHLDTPTAVTDESGTIQWQAHYQPFGEAIVEVSNLEQNFRFPGQYFDQETGLHYNYFRIYDPSTGRYITSDPIGLAGGLNTYGYAVQNPVNFIDPDGLAGKEIFLPGPLNILQLVLHSSPVGEGSDITPLNCPGGGGERRDKLIVGGVGKGEGRNAVTLNINKGENPDVVGVAQNLPFEFGSFDNIDLERLPFDQLDDRTFKEASRVLLEGGTATGITGSRANLNQIKQGLENGGFSDVRVQFGIGQNAGVEFSGVK